MLVGRTRELDLLGQALDDALVQGGSALFITGEPGIGKSTLVAAVQSLATARGFDIAIWASTEDAWSPAYTPWSTLLARFGAVNKDLAAASDPETSPEEHRFHVRRVVLSALREAAARRPLVLVFDDMQWLDQPSRELLLDVIREIGASPALFVGTWRTPIPAHDPDAQSVIAHLHREPRVRWLNLTGLEEPEVGALATALGWSASPESIQRLTARTQGNPFFVTEIARLAGATSAPGDGAPLDALDPAVPQSIQHVVRSRLGGLADPTRHLLDVASINPGGSDFAFLLDMTELGDDDLLAAIDDALANGFFQPVSGRGDRYGFSHQIVRETIAAGWSPSRRVRLHRRAAEALERLYAGRTDEVASELAAHWHASRSLGGASTGIAHALTSAGQATRAFDYGQAVAFLDMSRELAATEPITARADIAWRRVLSLAQALRIAEAEEAAAEAIDLLIESGASPDILADICWQLAHALNAVGANAAIRQRLRKVGMAGIGDRRDMRWARLRLLGDPIETVPNDVLYAARWLGYDEEARRIALQSDRDEDQVQAIESFDPRNPFQTRELIAQARRWSQPRATLRGLTAAANDLTYRHGAFRQAMQLWNEILAIARRIDAVPWQANALNQITLLHVTLGEFELAVASKRLADDSNALLGPANDTEALQMERDFALSHYLDGDWPALASYWLDFAGNPPLGLETQLAVPLYAAMAASAAASAGTDATRTLRFVDALARIAATPGIQQVNGVVAWAGDAVYRLAATDRAAPYDRLAAAILDSGIGDYPQTSLLLTRARMLTLLGDSRANRMFEQARESLVDQGQAPLLGIACYEQAIAPFTSLANRKRLLGQAIDQFASLRMTYWLERATDAAAPKPDDQPDLGVSSRELEVLRLIAQGRSDRRIADELFISERTVHAHVRNILRKTDTANRIEVTNWARTRGILDL